VSGDTFAVPRLRAGEGPTEGDPVVARLQLLLRGVRGALGEGDWDVEWADDGIRCWLVQARPVTRPTRRNEAFTAATHREILPDPPSRFMTSLIASSADELFASFRRIDRVFRRDVRSSRCSAAGPSSTSRCSPRCCGAGECPRGSSPTP
jgi:pyruvate,water dikinase